jgi:hypothetical protein
MREESLGEGEKKNPTGQFPLTDGMVGKYHVFFSTQHSEICLYC